MKQVTLKINGKDFKYFNQFNIDLKYNSLGSTFSFQGFLDPKDNGQKSLFKPLSYNLVQLYYAGELFLTGTTLNTSTSVSSISSLANISGYSLPGVLEDCQIPIDLYPLEFDNLNLEEITRKLIQPFGLSLVISSSVLADARKVYTKIAADPGTTIKKFLTDLASQRNLVITHNTYGNVVITRARASSRSIATYEENVPSTTISVMANGQALHSKITSMKQATVGTDQTGESTISNSLISKYRPAIVLQNSGTNDDSEAYAKKSRGSELRAVQVVVETDRWQWYDGRRLHLIMPNNNISVLSPSNSINRRAKLFVESVSYTGTTDINTAVLKCVMPECYTGAAPKNIFR